MNIDYVVSDVNRNYAELLLNSIQTWNKWNIGKLPTYILFQQNWKEWVM